MKIITLKEPWATLIAEGIKEYEFRTWNTNYRGKILIHAGTGIDKKEMDRFQSLNLEYPSAKIIAVADLVDVIKIDDEFNNYIKSLNNIAYGDKTREGYAFVLKNVKKINYDEIVKGKLGIWNYDIDEKNLKKVLM